MLQILFAVFHILLSYIIYSSGTLIGEDKADSQALNIALTAVMFFLGYITLYAPEELFSTKTGKAASILIIFIYIARVVEEFVLYDISRHFGFSIVIIVLCLLIAAGYLTCCFSLRNTKTHSH